MHIRLKLTTVQLSEDEHARLIANMAFRHGQELGSVLGDRKPFDLLFIIRDKVGAKKHSRIRFIIVQMCGRVLSDISSAFSSTILYAPSWVGDARTKPELRYGWDFSANNFGNASGLFRSSCGSEY